jgi:hypothetical protein
MLEGLDSIDWSSLTHAHGPATDVPKLLRSLASEDSNVRMEACAILHETIWHQGTVFPASAAIVPFLFELVIHPDVSDKGCSVALLASIATGEGVIQYGVRVDGEEAMRRRLGKSGRTLDESLAEERAMMEAIHQDVSRELRHLLPYLSDKEGLGALVAEVLGHFPEHCCWLTPAIDKALAQESDDHIRQMLAKSKARLTRC